MTVTISVLSDDTEAEPIAFDMPRIVLGRGPNSDIRLPDPSVSHMHATVRRRGSEYVVIDEGSTNGTHVGPVRLASGSPRVLRNGDVVKLGRVGVRIGLEPTAVPSPNPAELTKVNALRLVAAALEAEHDDSAHPRVTVSQGPDATKSLVLKEFHRRYTVGREACDLTLTDEDVSRTHLELTRKAKGILIRELNSKNGTLLDSSILKGSSEAWWEPGSTLHVGQSSLSIENAVPEVLSLITQAPDEVIPLSSPEPEEKASPSSAHPPVAPPRPTAPRTRNWTAIDVFVAILAVAVLTASLIGLSWLVPS